MHSSVHPTSDGVEMFDGITHNRTRFENIRNTVDTKAGWDFICAHLRAEKSAKAYDDLFYQYGQICHDLLERAILKAPINIIDLLLKLGIIPQQTHLKVAFEYAEPGCMTLLLQSDLTLSNNEYLLSAAKKYRWAVLNEYLAIKKSSLTQAILSELLYLAFTACNFAQADLLIEEYNAIITDKFDPANIQLWDVLDSADEWREASIATSKGDHVKVSYNGWDDKWDEWIDTTKSAHRFAKFQTLSRGQTSTTSPVKNWQTTAQNCFLQATTAAQWECVNKHFTKFIDTANKPFLQKILSHALKEVHCPDTFIQQLLSLRIVATAQDIENAFYRDNKQQLLELLDTNKSIDATSICIRAAENNHWQFVHSYLERKKIAYTTLRKLVDTASKKSDTTELESLCKFDWDNDTLSLLILWAAQEGKFKVVEICLSNKSLSADILEKIFLIAIEKSNLSLLAKLALHNKHLSAYETQETNLSNEEFIALSRGRTVDAWSAKKGTWHSGEVLAQLGNDHILVKFYSTGWNIRAYNLKTERSQLAKPHTFSNISNKEKFKYAMHIKTLLQSAETIADWEYICQTLPTLKDKNIITASFLRILLHRALKTAANDQVISFILSLGTIVTSKHIDSAIRHKKTDWFNEISQENLTRISYRCAHNKNWDTIKIFLEKKLISTEVLNILLMILIRHNHLAYVKALIVAGADIKSLDLTKNYPIDFITSTAGIEQSMLCDYKNNNGEWCTGTILKLDDNIAIIEPMQSWRSHLIIDLAKDPLNIMPHRLCADNTYNYPLKQHLSTTFSQAKDLADCLFVMETLDKLDFTKAEKELTLRWLLHRVLECEPTPEDMLSVLMQFEFTYTPNDIQLSFTPASTANLERVLREDKHVNNEDALKSAARAEKWEHVHVYLNYRKPSEFTLRELLVTACAKKNDQEFQYIVKHGYAKQEQAITAALNSCWLNGFEFGYNMDLAILVAQYGNLPNLKAIFLTASSGIDWLFVKKYFENVNDTIDNASLPQYLDYAISREKYSIVLIMLNRFVALHISNKNSDTASLMMDYRNYCNANTPLEDKWRSPPPTTISSISASIYGAFQKSPQMKFIAASKFIIYLTTGENIFTPNEVTALKQIDLKGINPASPMDLVKEKINQLATLPQRAPEIKTPSSSKN